MHWKTLLIIALAMTWGAPPAGAQSEGDRAISKSGRYQATVVDAPLGSAQFSQVPPPPGADWVTLEPRLVTVFFERIADDCGALLGFVPQTTTAPATVVIDPTQVPDSPIVGAATRYRNGWRFAIRSPETVSRKRLVHAAVDLILTQRTRLSPGPHDGRPPTWLTRGIAEYLLANATRPYYPEVTVNLAAATGSPLNNAVLPRVIDPQRFDPQEHARTLLAGQATLDWTALAQPTIDFQSPAQTTRYDASAMLLVGRLLRLDARGTERFRVFLAQLNQYRNWPLAFREGFDDAFPTPLDFEKWWAIERRLFETRESYELLRLAESASQLRNLLTFGVGFQSAEDADEPTRIIRFLSLPELIDQAGLRDQNQALRTTRANLASLAVEAAPEIALVIHDYASALDRYLQVIDNVLSGRITMAQWRASRGRFKTRIETVEATLASIAPPPTEDSAAAEAIPESEASSTLK